MSLQRAENASKEVGGRYRAKSPKGPMGFSRDLSRARSRGQRTVHRGECKHVFLPVYPTPIELEHLILLPVASNVQPPSIKVTAKSLRPFVPFIGSVSRDTRDAPSSFPRRLPSLIKFRDIYERPTNTAKAFPRALFARLRFIGGGAGRFGSEFRFGCSGIGVEDIAPKRFVHERVYSLQSSPSGVG